MQFGYHPNSKFQIKYCNKFKRAKYALVVKNLEIELNFWLLKVKYFFQNALN